MSRNPDVKKPKQPWQLRRLFGLAKQIAALTHQEPKDYLESLARTVTGRNVRLSELYFHEAAQMISLVESQINQRPAGDIPLRTIQHRRMKANIKQIETKDHRDLIEDLRKKLGYSKEYVAGISQKANKRPDPPTTEEGNRVIETLKNHLRARGRKSRRATV